MNNPKYTKKEVADFILETNIDWNRLPFWIKVKWSIMGPPFSTGPK